MDEQACLNCAKSKCRCITRPGGQGCEKCHRLNKPCLPGASIRKRNAQDNNANTRIAHLEGKVDGLVALLGSNSVMCGSLAEDPSRNTLSTDSPLSNSISTATPNSLGWSSSTQPSLCDTAQDCLDDFRDHMLKYFPFLHLPDDVDWVCRERPFLLLCITAATSKSTQKRLALGREIKQTLAQRTITDDHGMISLDLLLGLLTFIAWGHDQLLNDNPTSLSRFAQLAVTLAIELRLNRPSAHNIHMLPVNSSNNERDGNGGSARSLEERRAVLACYVMSTVVSTYFAQTDAMQWTPYMEESLQLLSKERESPNDEKFTCQVRLQLIERDITNVKATTVPLEFCVKALGTALDEVKKSSSARFREDGVLLASVYHAELSIAELVLCKEAPGASRLKYLHACLSTVKSALDNFFKFPPSDYLAFSFPFFTQLARCIVVLYKLSTLSDPIWDTDLARSTVDIIYVVDRVISNLELAEVNTGDNSENGVSARSARIFKSVRAVCSSKITECARWEGSAIAGCQTIDQCTMSTEPFGLGLEGMYDAWLNDVLADGGSAMS